MIGLAIISHSEKLAEGAAELTREMAQDVPVSFAGGTVDGRLGSSLEKIICAIESVYSDDGVIILFDLGSSVMTAEVAIENMEEYKRSKIHIVDAPLVEGAIVAAIEISSGKSIQEVLDTLKAYKLNKY
ncbi:PTS-dependent dihydroxyacetone kinase, phosphotransferase subunit DhaM [Caloramator mitchellensis]|uniref:phosphoenolpyruvate--glycerone phosphotransferase n=1 Tax=Caloramator mitchellensis TaxID=908809 RepID=A0A0R3K5P2_CALMK|nr:dihydroxyacetone kinase phosphoryl donor subunit DhaM [Caloramator mitchellensis]KRQ87695.1 PTS-dependent dihydroxyacetone kinase, phosphotransferase subunit DhaM [Caloramator mitchellensis]